MKRRIYILLGILAILAIVVIFVFVLKRPAAPSISAQPPGSLPTTGTARPGGIPGAGNAGGANDFPSGGGAGDVGGATKFGIVSNEPVFDYFIDAQNNTTVVEPDGKIARVTNGQATLLSSTEIRNFIMARFSYDGGKVIANFGDPADPQTSVFDIAAKAWTPLAGGITSPAWSPSDNRIAYIKNNADGTKTVSTLDVSKATSKPVALLRLSVEDLSLAWPNKNQIELYDKPSSYARGSVWLFDLQKKTLMRPVPESYGLETLWSNTTSSFGLVFSSGVGGYGGTLSLLLPLASTTRDVTFLTFPSKCTFNFEAASSTAKAPATPYLALYCAVPRDPDRLSGVRLPDDYEQMALFTSDGFYKIHTDTGLVEALPLLTGDFDATALKLFNRTLFFINRYDRKLYAISLAQ